MLKSKLGLFFLTLVAGSIEVGKEVPRIGEGVSDPLTGCCIFFIIIAGAWFVKSISWVISLLIVSTLIVYVLNPLLVYFRDKLKLPHSAESFAFYMILKLCESSL